MPPAADRSESNKAFKTFKMQFEVIVVASICKDARPVNCGHRDTLDKPESEALSFAPACPRLSLSLRGG
jgi:hypothetical protein